MIVGKLCLLPKTHELLYNVPGGPLISNCGTLTEKASEFVDFLLKFLMQSDWPYIRDSGDFIDKMKKIGKHPKGFFLVTADVVGLYPSIPHKEGIFSIKKQVRRINLLQDSY